MNDTLNITLPQNFFIPRNNTIQYVTHTYHLISIPQIIMIFIIFVFLSYWYIRVNNNKEEYQHWMNPNNTEVDLYKIIRICFWAYTGIIIIFGIISILMV